MVMGQPQNAVQDLNQLIRIKPNDLDAHANRAIVLVSLGENERAQIDFDQAVELGAESDRLQVTIDRVRRERDSSTAP